MIPDRLSSLLSGFRGARAAVVGDLMLDEYVWGDVTRISPDAPVQVVEIRRRSHAVGGAGNVAHNLVAAGGAASLFGVVGSDASGLTLSALLREAGIDTAGLITQEGRRTTVKTRVIARGQNVVRLDEEVRDPLEPRTRAGMLDALARALPGCGAILVSDYAKGVIDHQLVGSIVELCRRAGRDLPVIVDPKSADFSRYSGCTAITPNQREAEIAAGMTIRSAADLEEASARIRKACGAPWVLITCGEKGMTLSDQDGRLHEIPAKALEVFDVTGAGDTVLAYFGIAVASGLDALESATLANLAAGVSVGKVGTTAVGPSEVLAAMLRGQTGTRKIATLREAVARAEHERSLGRRIVFTNGCFDLLHAGHVHLLERSRALGDFLVVAVNSDASVHRLKGEGRPLVGEEDRLKVLSALDAVDLVVVFDEDTPLAVIREIRPDVLVKGGDYTTETIVGHEFVLGYGGSVETVPLAEGRSTTALISAIRGNQRT